MCNHFGEHDPDIDEIAPLGPSKQQVRESFSVAIGVAIFAVICWACVLTYIGYLTY